MKNTNELSNDVLLAILQEGGLTQAGLDDDDDLFVPRGIGGMDALEFGTWVQIMDGAIRFHTFAECSQEVDAEALVGMVNRLNHDMLYNRFTWTKMDDGKIFMNGDYCLLVEESLSSEYLVSALRLFAAGFIIALREADPGRTVFVLEWE